MIVAPTGLDGKEDCHISNLAGGGKGQESGKRRREEDTVNYRKRKRESENPEEA